MGAAYSAFLGWTASRELPERLRPLAYRAFARAVGANLDEAELPLAAYPTLGDFFARGLRPGARPIDQSPDTLIAPCDGAIAARGTATGGTLLQAKGRTYRLAELVADDALAERLGGGDYVTIYLSPRDYHRVHAPLDGRLMRYDYIPGALWPVNPRLAARRDALLARNERVVIHLNAGAAGELAIVMVGASGVGNIRLALPASPAPPDSASFRAAHERHRVELGGIPVRRGDELGAFRLGSTVVMICSPGALSLEGRPGRAVRFGEPLGRRARTSASPGRPGPGAGAGVDGSGGAA